MGDAEEMPKLSYALSKKVFFTFVNLYFKINKNPLKTNKKATNNDIRNLTQNSS